MVMLQVEDGVKRKTPQLQSCWNFFEERSRHKIYLIPCPDDRDKPDPLNPRLGDGNPRSYIKGRNLTRGGTPPPTNCSRQKPRFCLSHGYHLHGGGLPRSHEGRGLRGGAPPWCRRQGRSSPRRCRRPASLAAPFIVFISITNSSLYTVVHPPTNLCTVLYKHGVRCYKL
jgi:hypothetical protein